MDCVFLANLWPNFHILTVILITTTMWTNFMVKLRCPLWTIFFFFFLKEIYLILLVIPVKNLLSLMCPRIRVFGKLLWTIKQEFWKHPSLKFYIILGWNDDLGLLLAIGFCSRGVISNWFYMSSANLLMITNWMS